MRWDSAPVLEWENKTHMPHTVSISPGNSSLILAWNLLTVATTHSDLTLLHIEFSQKKAHMLLVTHSLHTALPSSLY